MSIVFLLASALASITSTETNATLTTADAINRAIVDNRNVGQPFDLSATVLFAHTHKHGDLTAVDDKGDAVTLWDHRDNERKPAKEGCRFRMRGTLINCPFATDLHIRRLMPSCAVFEQLDPRCETPEPAHLTIKQAQDPARRRQLVVVSGLLRDVFKDEIDPNYVFLLLTDAGMRIFAEFSSDEDPALSIAQFLGKRISLTGIIASDVRQNSEHLVARHIDTYISTHRSSILPTDGVPTDPFDVPQAPSLNETPTARIDTLGRCRISGRIIALWDHDNALLKTESGQLSTIKFFGECIPPCGSCVTVSGIPTTDTYQINLHHAIWRPEKNDDTSGLPDSGKPMRLNDIVKDEEGRRRFNSRMHGRTLTLRGRLIVPSLKQKDAHVFFIEQDGDIAKVDCTSVPAMLQGIESGSTVQVTGTCVMELKHGLSLPHITDFLLAVRSRQDLRVIARPPWWTFWRFMAILAVLSVIFVITVIWTVMLKRLSERRGAELADERIAVVETELKVYERTRLAIELHDMLSQMLSGISMQIGTVRKFLDSNREKALQHLDIATKTLLACRENLRDCLWDLRNHALEEPDMDKAIRETLKPHVEDATVVIRFSVPRDRLTDNTAHAILNIIRELAVNALRHGKATVVKIAGCIEDGEVLFSVADNGCGFDPNTAPGLAQGHFGLQGIRERVEGFEGEMSIASKNGHGSKVSISLHLPKEKTERIDNG